MKAELLWLGLSVLVAFFSFALLKVPQPAAPSPVAPSAVALLAVPHPSPRTITFGGQDFVPVPNTNGVPLPKETPYDDRPVAKAHYLDQYCAGYRQTARNPLYMTTTRCTFGMPQSENETAADAGWFAGEATANADKQLQRRRTPSVLSNGNGIITLQFP